MSGGRAVKRACLALFDVLSLVVVAFLALPVFSEPAYAYVDPSVMTYTIQALAGVAVALSAVAGVAFRRSRKAIMKALNIDENAKKQQDASWARLECSEANLALDAGALGRGAADVGAKDKLPQKRGEAEKKSLPWARRFALSFASTLFLAFTVVFVAPCEIVAASSGSTVASLGDIWQVLAFATAVFAVLVSLLVSLLRGRVFSVVVAIVFAFGLCCYLQAMFLNVGMPLADGSAIDWEDYRAAAFISEAVWLAVIALFIYLTVQRERIAQAAIIGLSAALIIVQGVGVASLFMEYSSARAGLEVAPSDMIVTEDGLFDISDKDNVIVFVLDTYDTQDLIRVYKDNPHMLDEFTGFTWYQNSSGSLIPTRYGVPFLLTDIEPKADESWSEFLGRRYVDGTFLRDMNTLGYSVGLYSDSVSYMSELDPALAWPNVGAQTINIEKKTPDSFSKTGILKGSLKVALFRDLSWTFKPFFMFDTNYYNAVTVRHTIEAEDHIAYALDDSAYFEKLKYAKLRVVEDDGAGAYRFIHLNGVHTPYILDENGNKVGSERSSEDKQCVGSMKIVEEYIRQLKELGVYDETTFIITADHGDWYFTDKPLEYPSSPYILVKPGHQSAEEAAAPLQTSYNPVSHMDFCASVIKAMGGNYEPYGIPVEDVPDEPRERFYYMLTTYIKYDDDVLQYRIGDDALDINDWELTGVAWHDVWGAHRKEAEGQLLI